MGGRLRRSIRRPLHRPHPRQQRAARRADIAAWLARIDDANIHLDAWQRAFLEQHFNLNPRR